MIYILNQLFDKDKIYSTMMSQVLQGWYFSKPRQPFLLVYKNYDLLSAQNAENKWHILIKVTMLRERKHFKRFWFPVKKTLPKVPCKYICICICIFCKYIYSVGGQDASTCECQYGRRRPISGHTIAHFSLSRTSLVDLQGWGSTRNAFLLCYLRCRWCSV